MADWQIAAIIIAVLAGIILSIILLRRIQMKGVDTMNVAQKLLGKIREAVKDKKLDMKRLPVWVKYAKITWVKISNSYIILFEDSSSNVDVYKDEGIVNSDVQFFMNIPKFIPTGACLNAREEKDGGLMILGGSYTDRKFTHLALKFGVALFNINYIQYHSPIALQNLFIQLSTDYKSEEKGDISAIRFIPFAIYIHIDDMSDFNSLWRKCTPHIIDSLEAFHNSEQGTYYSNQLKIYNTLSATKKESVIVLGKDTGTELSDLIQVRDYLIGMGYDAHLIKDLPEPPMISIEEKVEFWCGASRFCVMIDKEPAGHIAEYVYLKNQRTILAFLRQKGKGSTRMIGDVDQVDINYFKSFEFDNTPLEIIDLAVRWAEDHIRKRIKAYANYPWRRTK